MRAEPGVGYLHCGPPPTDFFRECSVNNYTLAPGDDVPLKHDEQVEQRRITGILAAARFPSGQLEVSDYGGHETAH
jgi:hypothetical protein